MKKAISYLLLLVMAISFVCICSEPVEEAPITAWVAWEAAWVSALWLSARIWSKLNPEDPEHYDR